MAVVPATGGVQGKHFIDVNHVAARLAAKLQGRAFQIHAPIFAASREEARRADVLAVGARVLARAREARVALVGIGSVHSDKSTYFNLQTTGKLQLPDLGQSGAAGELVAHLIDRKGELCDYPLNERVVALTPAEFKAVPLSIGISAGERKAEPIASVLSGGFLDALATDEATAARVVDILKG